MSRKEDYFIATKKAKLKDGTIKEYNYYCTNICHSELKRGFKQVSARSPEELAEKVKSELKQLDEILFKKDGFQLSEEMLFGDFFEWWLYDYKALDVKQSTLDKYDSVYRNHIKGTPIMRMQVCDVKSTHVVGYYKSLLMDGIGHQVRKDVDKLISPALEYAYNEAYIDRPVHRNVKVPRATDEEQLAKRERDKHKALTLDELEKVLDAFDGHPLKAYIHLLAFTGLRQGEAFALTWHDVDFEKMTIEVSKNYKKSRDLGSGKYIGKIQPAKTAKSDRVVPIDLALVNILRIHKAKQDELKKEAGESYNDNNLVICTDTGTYFDSQNINKRIKKMIREQGLPDFTSHSLRHTYATLMIENGTDAKTTSELLGHSNVNITLDTYTHPTDKYKREAVNKISQFRLAQ